MKHTFFILAVVKALILVTFLPDLRAQENDVCLIAIRNDGDISLLSSEEIWDVSIPIEDYVFSPSHSHIAIQFDTMSPESRIGIYRVTESGLQEQAILENTRFIRGSIWSDDGSKLLLQNSESDHLIYVYDLVTNQVIPLTDALLPTLQIYQVAWTPNNHRILFVATESPFPTTEFGRNNVVALYLMDTDTLDLKPISQPDENVQWYFDNFIELSNNQIVYSSCSAEDSTVCSLNTISSDETFSTQGSYTILGSISQGEVLISSLRQTDSEEVSEFEIFVLDTIDGTLASILTVPTISDFPVPIVSLSPDKSKLSYMADDTSLAIFDMQQRTSRLIASVGIPSSGKWNPNSNELLYWTDDSLYVYKYDLAEAVLIQGISEDHQPIDFMWLCTEA